MYTTNAPERPTNAQSTPLLVAPFLQLAKRTLEGAENRFNLLVHWHATVPNIELQIQQPGQSIWISVRRRKRIVRLPGVPEHFRFTAEIFGLEQGTQVPYRLMQNGNVIFAAVAYVPRSPNLKFGFLADCGDGSLRSKAIAFDLHQERPDVIVFGGDLCYDWGVWEEFVEKFFGVYNCDVADPTQGAPLLRSIPFVAVIGNHELGRPMIRVKPGENKIGLWAYFLFFDNNADSHFADEPAIAAVFGGSAGLQTFLQSTNRVELPPTNFAYNLGSMFLLALDGNQYMNWNDQQRRQWVRLTLKGTTAAWKFVFVHQPAFSADTVHGGEEQIRMLFDIFQECGVTAVFSGHGHIAEITYPIVFKPRRYVPGKNMDADVKVEGRIKLDQTFFLRGDGVPNGIFQFNNGNGGQLADERHLPDMDDLPVFTYRVEGHTCCLTTCDVGDTAFTYYLKGVGQRILQTIEVKQQRQEKCA
jgi:hypothetical protein